MYFDFQSHSTFYLSWSLSSNCFFSVLENNFLKIFLYLFLCKKFAPVPLGPHPTCTMGIIIWIIINLHALRTFNKIHCFYGVLDRRFVYTFLCKKKNWLPPLCFNPTSVDLYYKKWIYTNSTKLQLFWTKLFLRRRCFINARNYSKIQNYIPF